MEVDAILMAPPHPPQTNPQTPNQGAYRFKLQISTSIQTRRAIPPSPPPPLSLLSAVEKSSKDASEAGPSEMADTPASERNGPASGVQDGPASGIRDGPASGIEDGLAAGRRKLVVESEDRFAAVRATPETRNTEHDT